MDQFDVQDLDCRVLKGLVERFEIVKINAQRQFAALTAAKADHDDYLSRLTTAANIPIVDIDKYQINFLTKRIELKPLPSEPKPPVKAPDADEPPAPFVDKP